ncbi:bifunctional NAD(P)H-hydrate repair enzyme [Formosimonas limnophila]|uniref:Bifunctional NAD(P)H-hydrate repair enzyme n=1 Tax=Formosimonas limnophila TaxID=1384487 RepID=A0A8J3CFI1_9BURK|nr:NAD(P)H-hydrate dehydratase [Formosimonas limnophila]GHA64849.1 bifunctional NAD(P)H-hydrate repair enzyme [Formosimonas limnophila]
MSDGKNTLATLAMSRGVEEQAAQKGDDLMGRAARATVDWLMPQVSAGATIWVAAGVGNNGGDALLAASLLHERGFRVSLIVPTLPVSAATQSALRQCEEQGLPIWRERSEWQAQTVTSAPDWVIDGLLGIGLSRAPEGVFAELIDDLNALSVPIVALDVPSGVDAQTGVVAGSAIRACFTLTFLYQKSGLWMGDGADCSGEVVLADLDFASSSLIESDGRLNLHHEGTLSQLKRPRNSHKGRFGSVVVVGGHVGMVGAAILAGRAAFSAGVGKVLLHLLDDRLVVDPMSPELMMRGAMEDVSGVNAVVIGPGLGQSEQSLAALMNVLSVMTPQQSLVVDADALNLMAQHESLRRDLIGRESFAVLTPHPTEAARLLNISTVQIQANRIDAAQTLAKLYHSVVVLKGVGTVIASPDGAYCVNTTGGAALAVAGQGDVLSGLLAALLAMGGAPFEAACLAVYVHGMAGDDYTQAVQGTIGLSPSHMPQLISAVLNRLQA